MIDLKYFKALFTFTAFTLTLISEQNEANVQ